MEIDRLKEFFTVTRKKERNNEGVSYTIRIDHSVNYVIYEVDGKTNRFLEFNGYLVIKKPHMDEIIRKIKTIDEILDSENS